MCVIAMDEERLRKRRERDRLKPTQELLHFVVLPSQTQKSN